MPLDQRSLREACRRRRALVGRLESKWDDDAEFLRFKARCKRIYDTRETASKLEAGLQLLGGHARAIRVIWGSPGGHVHVCDGAKSQEFCIAHFRGHSDVDKFVQLRGLAEMTPHELEIYLRGVREGWWGHRYFDARHQRHPKSSLLDYLLATNGGAGFGWAVDYADFLYLEYLVSNAACPRRAGNVLWSSEAVEAKRQQFDVEVDPGWQRYYRRFARFDLRFATLGGEEQSVSALPDDTLEKVFRDHLAALPLPLPEQVVLVNVQGFLGAAQWSQCLLDLNIGPSDVLTCTVDGRHSRDPVVSSR